MSRESLSVMVWPFLRQQEKHRIHRLDADLVSGEASIMFFVFYRLILVHDREIRIVQIELTFQKDILLAVRNHAKILTLMWTQFSTSGPRIRFALNHRTIGDYYVPKLTKSVFKSNIMGALHTLPTILNHGFGCNVIGFRRKLLNILL